MINWLADNGYNCTVITTYPYYPHWKVQPPYDRQKNWYSKEQYTTAKGNTVQVYRCPHYVPANPSGLKRILLDFSFSTGAFFRMLGLMGRRKFDVVISVVPPLPLAMVSVLYKKMKKARFLYHVQDLQVEAARDLQMIRNEKAIRALFKLEAYILKQADVVSSISTGMVAKMQEKTLKPVLLFPNWADNHTIFPLPDKAALKTAFGFAPTDRVVLYSGAIGEKQGLEAILKAARTITQPGVQFVICGSGPYKEKLVTMAADMQLNNVQFLPLQPLEKLNAFLNMADVHLVIQKANAADLVMPSKLTNILAVGGLSIITANAGSSLHRLVQEHELAILAEAENDAALAAAIVQAVEQDSSLLQQNALRYAQEYLAIDTVMSRYARQAGIS